MYDFRECDRRSDGAVSHVLRIGTADASSEVLLKTAGPERDAASDCLMQQRDFQDTAETFDSRLLGLQKRHEEELEAIRTYHGVNRSNDVTDLLAAKTREHETEMARLQQEFSDLLSSREEALERVIEELRKEAEGKTKQLNEAYRDYVSLVEQHTNMKDRVKDENDVIRRWQAAASRDLGPKPVFPPTKSPKEGFLKLVRDPVFISLIAHLAGEALIAWKEADSDCTGEFVGLALGVLMAVTVGVAAFSVLDVNGATIIYIYGFGVVAFEVRQRLGTLLLGVLNGEIDFIEWWHRIELAATTDVLQRRDNGTTIWKALGSLYAT